MKDTYYFPHDYNAHKDPKCSALINDFGLTGYGVYWAIIEILHEQGGRITKFPKLYDGIAFQLNIPKEEFTKQIEAMLHDYSLLQQDENFIWSDRVLRNLEEREIKKMAKQQAGRLGGLHSGQIRAERSKMKHCLKQNEANEPKERKGKEILKEKAKSFFNQIITLKDGTRAKNYFGTWVDAENTNVKINVSYYPELQKYELSEN